VVRVESGFDPFAIGVNGPTPQRIHPRSLDEATDRARRLIATGANIDLGLGQINGANLSKLGLTIRAAFEPCQNLRAAGQVLQDAYRSQAPAAGEEQAALRRALSIYNTGRTERGFRNGYVAKVSAAAGAPIPAPTPVGPEALPPPAWDVFGRAPTARLVFTSTSTGDAP
jgi:type IV secretion system protein VirB1